MHGRHVDVMLIQHDDEVHAVLGDGLTAFLLTIARSYQSVVHGPLYFIFDNASVHRKDELADQLTSLSPDFHCLSLPPYLPRLNPIEQLWHAFKTPVKHEELNNAEAVAAALARSFAALSKPSFPRYFEHMQQKVYPLVQHGDDLHS
jgi:transposase